MKFGKAYKIYVQTEGQQIMPKIPYVEFERFKKLLKQCPHLRAPPDAPDALDYTSDVGASFSSDGTTTSSAGAVRGVVTNEHDEHSTDSTTDIVLRENTSSAASDKAHVSCPDRLHPEEFTNATVGDFARSTVVTSILLPRTADWNRGLHFMDQSIVCDVQFFPDLDKAVSEVVGCFNACAEDLLRQHMATGLRKYFMWLRKKMAGDNFTMVQVGNMLVSYGCMNSLAVRKILKKYDKIHGSESGRAFKSRLQGRRMELLQSPLLIELGALAVNLTSSEVPAAEPPQPQLQAPGHHSCSFDDEKQTITYSLPDGLRLDFDLTCSICLEVVFDPVALSCGHIFCNSCVCTAAAVSMYDGVNMARRNKKCPICRQTGVHTDAVSMGELHLLVSERCSSYYNERLQAEREMRVLDAKLHWEMQTRKFLSL